MDGDNEIFVINSDGTGLNQLTFNTAIDAWPSISGDGSKIAFESNVDGDQEIFVWETEVPTGIPEFAVTATLVTAVGVAAYLVLKKRITKTA